MLVSHDLPGGVIYEGHVLDALAQMPDESVHCVVTSPPYWGLRDYGIEAQVWGGEPVCAHEWSEEREVQAKDHEGWVWSDGGAHGGRQSHSWNVGIGTACSRCSAWRGSLGLEPTIELYVEHIVEVFRQVRRVLRKDGTLWLNKGDCYAAGKSGRDDNDAVSRAKFDAYGHGGGIKPQAAGNTGVARKPPSGLKPKDLVGMPWRVAFALQADGWYLRSDIIWCKPAPMPESVRDRPTKAHEYLFLLSKSERYHYDAEAIREPFKGANKRSVWTIPTEPFPSAHFATFPQVLVEPCVLAGTSERGCCPSCGAPWVRVVEREHRGDRGRHVPTYEAVGVLNRRMHPGSHPTAWSETTGWRPSCRCDAGEPVLCVVLDPFLGSGTTAYVAHRLGRRYVGIEIKADYVEMAKKRLEALPVGTLL